MMWALFDLLLVCLRVSVSLCLVLPVDVGYSGSLQFMSEHSSGLDPSATNDRAWRDSSALVLVDYYSTW